jgi:uncharacterized membrane protein YphA (DoxX/SURF4 family)
MVRAARVLSVVFVVSDVLVGLVVVLGVRISMVAFGLVTFASVVVTVGLSQGLMRRKTSDPIGANFPQMPSKKHNQSSRLKMVIRYCLKKT